jgi:hypothetical protein
LREKPVFKNRVLRRIFGPKRDEGTGDWRKVTPSVVRVMRQDETGGSSVMYKSRRGAHTYLVGTAEGKTPLLKPRLKGKMA